MMTLFFNATPVHDWETASQSNTARYARYFWGLIERGVYMPCSQYEALFISAAHSPHDIDETVPSPPSSLDLNSQGPSAARSGRKHLQDTKEEHTETSPALTPNTPALKVPLP